jgi:hypothetical protein
MLLHGYGSALIVVVVVVDTPGASFIAPREWVSYFPAIIMDNLPSGTVLKIFSVFELLLAAWLLSGVYIRWAALVCAATLGGIVLANFDLFQITFRDIALIFAALALASLTWDKD